MQPSLFFSTVVAYGFSAGNYWGAMIADICAALGRAGAPCDIVEAETNTEFVSFLLEARRFPRHFIASFNFLVPFPDLKLDGRKVLAQELFAARAVTIFLDHPAHQASAIAYFERAARGHKHRPAPAPPPVYGVMDPDHAGLLADLGIEAGRVFPFPQAGPAPGDPPPPLSERPVDILFFGSIGDLAPEDEFLRAQGLDRMGFDQVARAALQAALRGEEDVYLACKKGLAKIGWASDIQRIAEFARLIDIRVRAVRRHALLGSLDALKIVCCGEIAQSFRQAHLNATVLDPKPFPELLGLMRQSKIVLNDSINLRQSALMRLYYAMAQGCAVATEANDGLRAAFRDGEEAILLEPGQDHAGRLRDLLADPARLQAIADAGRTRQIAAHQWDHRVPALLKAVGGA